MSNRTRKSSSNAAAPAAKPDPEPNNGLEVTSAAPAGDEAGVSELGVTHDVPQASADEAVKADSSDEMPAFDPSLQPGNPGWEPGKDKHLSDQTPEEQQATKGAESVEPPSDAPAGDPTSLAAAVDAMLAPPPPDPASVELDPKPPVVEEEPDEELAPSQVDAAAARAEFNVTDPQVYAANGAPLDPETLFAPVPGRKGVYVCTERVSVVTAETQYDRPVRKLLVAKGREVNDETRNRVLDLLETQSELPEG